MSSAPVLIVAIDGPSGVGKTTAARRLAQRLEVPYLETGAMYRAAAVEILKGGVAVEDADQVESLVRALDLELTPDPQEGVTVKVSGKDVSADLRKPGIAETTSVISTYPGVRRVMVRLQREFAERHGGVVEGRDIGTKVFPDTPHKFFLEARLEVRSSRRFRQLVEAGRGDVTEAEVRNEVERRDYRDSHRETSPLSKDESYTVIDTSDIDVETVVELMLATISRTHREHPTRD